MGLIKMYQLTHYFFSNDSYLSVDKTDRCKCVDLCLKLEWRHNGRDSVSNHQSHDLLTQPYIQTQIKESIKAPRQWPLCGEFPAHMASNVENIFIWWRHHELRTAHLVILANLIEYSYQIILWVSVNPLCPNGDCFVVNALACYKLIETSLIDMCFKLGCWGVISTTCCSSY